MLFSFFSKSKKLTSFIVFFMLTASSCLVPRISYAIVNGREVEYGARGVYQIFGPSNRCSSVLLRPRWLLTADHCVNSKKILENPSRISVTINSNFNVEGEEIVRHPDSASRHGPNKMDIALIRLSEAVTLPRYPELSFESREDIVNQDLACYGYGVPGEGTLRRAILRPSGIFTANHNRVFFRPNSRGQITAPGDSGAPCFLRSQQGRIATVVSAGATEPPYNHASHNVARTFARWVYRTMNWEKIPGAAVEIATGGNAVWMIGNGNNRLYKWDNINHQWRGTRVYGKKISVDNNGYPFFLTLDNKIKQITPDGIKETVPGKASEIAFGNDRIWILGEYKNPQGGHKVYYWEGRDVYEVPTPNGRGATSLSADPFLNRIWITTPSLEIYTGYRVDGEWKFHKFFGLAHDTATGGNDIGARNTWALGRSVENSGGYRVYRLDYENSSWTRILGRGGEKIAVDHKNNAWIIGPQNRIYRYWAE